jgi:acyl-CoA synthetase (AMP-forming)/AMP-acid ligase II
MGLTAEDTFVSWAPPWHDLGLVRFILLPLYVGAPCHLVRPAIETIPLWLRTIEAVRATTTGAPDFAYRLAARMVPPGVDLSSLKHATNGGEPVRSSTIDTFEKHFGVSGVLRPGYGLAEATLGVTTVRAGESISVDPTGAVSCGRPLPGVEIAVEDDEILVRGETVFAGYFGSDESPVVDGWLHTGDAGRIGENGELYVLGRKRAMIKRAGAVIAPRELEEAALTVSGVKVAGATSVGARGRLIEEIVVAVEIEDDERQRIIGDVSQAIYRKLGFAPDRVVIMPGRAIPRTTNGKIRHEALRQLLAGSGRNRSRAGPISPGESDR